MKRLCCVGVCLGLFVCPAEEPTEAARPAEVAPAEAAKPARPGSKSLTDGEVKARREKMDAAREARDKASAEKAGLSVEEYRAQRRAKHEEKLAKRLGVTVEELRRMTPEEKKARDRELRKKRAEARAAKAEAKCECQSAVPGKCACGDKCECK